MFYRRAVSLGERGPMVSFTFDDFPRSAFLVGGATLEKFGARGTYYAASGLINTANELGELFREDDLRVLLDKGHEIGSHTFHHSSSRSVSNSAFQSDVKKGSEAIEILTGRRSSNFAYPYGHVTLQAKKTVAARTVSARGVVPGINGPEVDLSLLLANRLYGDLDGAQSTQELILESVQRKGWLIFYTHDVRPHPSAYGCTPELFEFAVLTAKEYGCHILTVDQVLDEIGVPGKYQHFLPTQEKDRSRHQR
jgi:peptidoglycan/xylan/chitin deacetylase (PgdA/CDA1 family)